MDKETNYVLSDVDTTCPAVGYQTANVCVPVTITPFASKSATSTKCCGDPVVKEGTAVCGGVKNGSCTFTVSQKICVAVPVEFGATAVVGDPYVDCMEASSGNICTRCSSEE